MPFRRSLPGSWSESGFSAILADELSALRAGHDDTGVSRARAEWLPSLQAVFVFSTARLRPSPTLWSSSSSLSGATGFTR